MKCPHLSLALLSVSHTADDPDFTSPSDPATESELSSDRGAVQVATVRIYDRVIILNDGM